MQDAAAQRQRRGALAGGAAIALNLLLSAFKLALGFLGGHVSLIADGLNNLSDCGSGAITLVSFRVAARPADREHPFGHRRAEYIATLAVAMLILLMGLELLMASVRSILGGESADPATAVYVLLAVSIAVKAGMGASLLVMGKKLSSDVLRATAIDSFSDCLASAVVVLGLALSGRVPFSAEGYAGCVVALFILREGLSLARDASSKLLGRAPDPALLASIRAELLAEGVLGVHDLRVYPYGPGTYFATVHIEMDASMSAIEAHEIIDGLERRVLERCGVALTAHLDPVDLTDSAAKELEERVRAAAEGMVEGLDLHDFRLIHGSVPRLVFEAGVPFSCPRSDAQLKDDLCRIVRILSDCEPVVTVERE